MTDHLFDHAPMFPPPVPAVSRDEMLAAYDAACERAARDGNPIDIAEARRLGRALDNPIVQVARTVSAEPIDAVLAEAVDLFFYADEEAANADAS